MVKLKGDNKRLKKHESNHIGKYHNGKFRKKKTEFRITPKTWSLNSQLYNIKIE